MQQRQEQGKWCYSVRPCSPSIAPWCAFLFCKVVPQCSVFSVWYDMSGRENETRTPEGQSTLHDRTFPHVETDPSRSSRWDDPRPCPLPGTVACHKTTMNIHDILLGHHQGTDWIHQSLEMCSYCLQSLSSRGVMSLASTLALCV